MLHPGTCPDVPRAPPCRALPAWWEGSKLDWWSRTENPPQAARLPPVPGCSMRHPPKDSPAAWDAKCKGWGSGRWDGPIGTAQRTGPRSLHWRCVGLRARGVALQCCYVRGQRGGNRAAGKKQRSQPIAGGGPHGPASIIAGCGLGWGLVRGPAIMLAALGMFSLTAW